MSRPPLRPSGLVIVLVPAAVALLGLALAGTGRTRAWATSFAFTLAVELPVGAWCLRRAPRTRTLAVLALATAITHPTLWWLLPRWFDDYWTFVVVGELAVVATEALVLRLGALVGWRDAASAALLANGSSYLGGMLLRAAGIWPAGA